MFRWIVDRARRGGGSAAAATIAAVASRGASQIEPLERRCLFSGGAIEASREAGELAAGEFVTLALARPSIRSVNPASGATNVRRDVAVSAYPNLPNAGHVVAASSLSNSTVKLYRTSDTTKTPIPANVNTSAAGDVITLTPKSALASTTKYTFEVTSGVKDTAGAAFLPFTSSFTTGTEPASTTTAIGFNKVSLSNATGRRFTGVTIGPDGRLYAGTMTGEILRWKINSDGTLSNTTVINTVRNRNGGGRIITGLRFEPGSTADRLLLWVSHGHPAESDAPDWTGKLSRLSGAALDGYDDFVTGLPRSVRDHLTNQMDFGPGGWLYLSQASNNAMGAPDAAWGMRPERLLNAAVLRIDLTAISARISSGRGPLNVKTQDGGAYNPYAADAPVKLYATGVRNAYDLLWHSNGYLYAPTNGSAPGGNTPAGGGAVGLKNVAQNEPDWLFKIRPGRYYGHPNPTRGEYVLNGGNPTSGADKYQVNAYPVGTQPDPDWDPAVYSFGDNRSPNGVIEYKSGAFGGALRGSMLVCRYSGGDDVLVLKPDSSGNIPGTGVKSGLTGLTGFADPLDLCEHVGPGNLYVAEYGGRRITLLRPRTNSIAPSSPITSISLVNADTDGAIRTLSAGATIDLSTLPTRRLSLRAYTSGTIGSIRFGFDGTTNLRTENYAPYTIAGEGANNDILPFAGMTVGTHTVRVTAYTGRDATGSVLGTTLSLTFTIVE